MATHWASTPLPSRCSAARSRPPITKYWRTAGPVQVLRSATGGRIGIVNHHTTVDAASRSRSDIAAAACYLAYHNRQFTEPLLRGSYPDEILRMPGVADDVICDGDLEVISAPLDFYGVTFHHPTMVAAAHGNSSVMVDAGGPAGVTRSGPATGRRPDPPGVRAAG